MPASPVVLLIALAAWGAPTEADLAGPLRVRPDTILRPDLSAPLLMDSVAALGPFARYRPAPERPFLRLGLAPVPLPFPAPAPSPGARPWWLGRPDSFAVEHATRLARRGTPRSFLREAVAYRVRTWGEPGRASPFLRVPPADVPAREGPPAEEGVGGFVSDYADLALRLQGQAELGGDWNRYRPCLDRFQEACNPGLLPQLSPELRFAVQVGGTVTDRVFVDVDFDQLREFESANTISVRYEGRENEIIHGLEVGDVTFELPRSRFVTQGIPSGNFGFQADGQVGPIDFQGVWAEQKGDVSSRVFRLTGVGPERGFVQEDTVVLDDAEYVDGQFFFLVDPTSLVNFPHADVLALDGSEAPASLAPGADPIQIYRYDNEPVVRQQVEGLIQADAVLERGGDRVEESGWFRYLQDGVDYFVHPSGLWIALRNPLRDDEMLAATFITASGDTVGDYNPEGAYNIGQRPELRLLKASAANHQPGRPTWDMEMHQVYRVSGSPDVDPASIEVTVSLGELSAGRTFARGPAGDDITFLRLLGLDAESPFDEVDPGFVYDPTRELFQDQSPVRGTFIVFPTLRPFAAPPPLRGLGLSETQTREILGDDANQRIYEEEDPFERESAGRFRLTIPFRVRSENVISSFSLGAFGIRDGSERIRVGDRVLVRGVDYDIDYDVGQVTLRNPESLFAADPDAAVHATWEQNQIFQTAPTSVFGLSGFAGLGARGEFEFMGLHQIEKTLVTRPTLGLEPASITLGGVSGRVRDRLDWLERGMDHVPGLRYTGESEFRVDGELAFSLPTPNTAGDVFLDDFDAPNERPLSLLASEWTRGSAPTFRDGATDALPVDVDATSLAALVWQHTWILESPLGDSLGIHEGFLPRQEIDQQIRISGNETREPGLSLSFGGPGPGATGPAWASVTTTLSPVGTDLSKSDFLEFYVSGGGDLTLVVDVGTLSEDAMFVGPGGATSGVKENGVMWGQGLLDHEADPSLGEIWGDAADARGVWGESCVAERGRIYRLGDERANCTRGNGRRDSEDLDGDGNLDDREKHLRWIVRLDGTSPYLARDRAETGTDFRLYRIPLQGPSAVEVGGTFADADRRAVRHVRLTPTGTRRERVTLARMRVVGSRWIRRAQDGVLRGLAGDTLAGIGRIEVTPVSRVTEGDAYASPPGVLEQLVDPTQAVGGQGVEFNEKSLALRFEDLQPGDRTEVYNRFPQRPRNLLTYREARLWVVAREGDFSGSEPQDFFLKVGSDSENFYLYRTPLRPPVPGGNVTASDWLPEVVVDFDPWFDLRRRAEEVLAFREREAGDPVVLWSADSTHAVVLTGRGSAPDLANVREIATGVLNRGSRPIRGEIWVDELRLSRGATDAGLAAHLDVGLNAGDVLDASLVVSRRGAFFRQLREVPTYQTDRSLSFRSTLRMDRLTPAEWGVDLPLTVAYDRVTQDPTFLQNSDVRADRLVGLRDIGSRRTRVSMGFRKRTPTAHPLISALVDGLEANLGWFRSEDGAVTSRHEAQGVDARLSYARVLDRRDFTLVPDFLAPLVRFMLPEGLEERLLATRLRWSPERFSLGAAYLRHDNRIFRFPRIIEGDEDSLTAPTQAPRESLRTSAELRLRPLETLTADVTLFTTRGLLETPELVSDFRIQRVLEDQRRSFLGVDWGWETNRIVRTTVGFRPRLFPWLQSTFDWSADYASDRNATFVDRVETTFDTLIVLRRNARGGREVRGSLTLDPGALSQNAFGVDSAAVRWSPLPEILSVLRPLSVSVQDGISARYSREPVAPGVGFQLGLGSVEDFRFVDDDTASTLTDRTAWRASGGIAIPLGVELDVGWTDSEANTLDTRSDRTIRDRTWPDVRARLRSVPMPAPVSLAVTSVSLSTGYQRNEREIDFGGRGEQRRVQTDRQIPVDVTLDWVGPTVTRYEGAIRVGEGRDPTGGTDRDRELHRLTLTGALRPPGSFAERLDRPVQVSLIASYITERECRTVVRRGDCVPFIDQIDRGLALTLDTSLRGFVLGLQSSFTSRRSFVGQRNGSSQFQLGLFGRFLIETGSLPAAVPGPR